MPRGKHLVYRDRRRKHLVLASVLIGFVTVFLVYAIYFLVTDAFLDLSEETALFIIQVGLAISPFLAISVFAERSTIAWIVGIGLTLVIWGYYLYDSISHFDTGRGASIELALLVLISPALITAASLVAARLTDGKRNYRDSLLNPK